MRVNPITTVLGGLIGGSFFLGCAFLAIMRLVELCQWGTASSSWTRVESKHVVVGPVATEWVNSPRQRHQAQIASVVMDDGPALIVAPIGTDISQGWITPSSARKEDLPEPSASSRIVYRHSAHPLAEMGLQMSGLVAVSLLGLVIVLGVVPRFRKR